MAEISLDISVQDLRAVGSVNPESVELVITLCAEEVCPVFLSGARRLRWPLQAPDREEEAWSDAERLHAFRVTRELLCARLEASARGDGMDDAP